MLQVNPKLYLITHSIIHWTITRLVINLLLADIAGCIVKIRQYIYFTKAAGIADQIVIKLNNLRSDPNFYSDYLLRHTHMFLSTYFIFNAEVQICHAYLLVI